MRNCCLLAIILLLSSCHSEEPTGRKPIQLSAKDRKDLAERSIKKALAKEQVQIERYIQRTGKQFHRTKTGVQFLILGTDSSTKKISTGDEVLLESTLSLLNGKLIHKKKKEWIKVGQSNGESGIHEVLLQLRENAQAKVILPSHRAHGFMGDDKEIPGLSSLIYDLQIVQVKPHE